MTWPEAFACVGSLAAVGGAFAFIVWCGCKPEPRNPDAYAWHDDKPKPRRGTKGRGK